jgi:hypothetical protein
MAYHLAQKGLDLIFQRERPETSLADGFGQTTSLHKGNEFLPCLLWSSRHAESRLKARCKLRITKRRRFQACRGERVGRQDTIRKRNRKDERNSYQTFTCRTPARKLGRVQFTVQFTSVHVDFIFATEKR